MEYARAKQDSMILMESVRSSLLALPGKLGTDFDARLFFALRGPFGMEAFAQLQQQLSALPGPISMEADV
jgi:hypothetical protein